MNVIFGKWYHESDAKLMSLKSNSPNQCTYFTLSNKTFTILDHKGNGWSTRNQLLLPYAIVPVVVIINNNNNNNKSQY